MSGRKDAFSGWKVSVILTLTYKMFLRYLNIIFRLINLTTECNSGCICDSVPYSPVCHEDSGMTFFSPCHAGCHKWNETGRFYSDCTCTPVPERLLYGPEMTTIAQKKSTQRMSFNEGSQYKKLPDDYEDDYGDDTKESILPSILPSIVLSSTMETPTSFSMSQSSTSKTTMKSKTSPIPFDEDSLYDDYSNEYFDSGAKQRQRRDLGERLSVMLSGACMKGCAIGFYLFTMVSALINIFGASGRIGNLLVNYR